VDGMEGFVCGTPIWLLVFDFATKGTASSGSGVWGDDDPDEDESGLEGSR